jgi:hypothetical protein
MKIPSPGLLHHYGSANANDLMPKYAPVNAAFAQRRKGASLKNVSATFSLLLSAFQTRKGQKKAAQ